SRMKYVISFLLILAVLISSCATPQPDTTDTKPSSYNKTEDIEKPIITENKSIVEKEKTNKSQFQEPSVEEVCINAGGSWSYFPNTCVDSCAKARSKEPVLCGQAFTWGCECGSSKCWNDKSCEPIIKEELLPPENKTIQDNIGCGNFLSNENVMFGYPSSERILERQAYVLSHDDDKKVARWVSYHLTDKYLAENAIRSDKFKADPDIPKGKRAELEDYKGSGFDRGHIAPSADMLRSQSINDESFLLSNMAPQDPSLNRGIWATLEDDVRNWAKKRKSIWIIAGPILDNGHKTIGPNKVGVPQRFYKIVVSGQNCNFDSISFIFPNEKAQSSLENYITSIDKIESETGLNFLDVIDNTLEEKIESASAKGLWDS
ncbi:MAG: DNA/RNA non-specific endonuclease, partial [Nanoarchaeota archaeon]